MVAFIGVDVGGTFTDFSVSLSDGREILHKLPSTPGAPDHAIIEGLKQILARGVVAPGEVVRLAHGTTVGTNALIQRRVGKVAMVTTAGFRNLLEIGRQTRPKVYDIHLDHPKARHGRVEERTVTVSRDVDWLAGERRFPGELRLHLPGVATLVRVCTRAELADRCRVETRYYISSAGLDAKRAGDAVRSHWAIENSLHWVLDVTFADDQARVRKGHGARNMAVLRADLFNGVWDARTEQLLAA